MEQLVKSLYFSFAVLSFSSPAFAAESEWHLADEIVASIQEPRFPARQANLVDYGAIADGETDALPAIRAAIHDLSRLGGGSLVVPRGIWFSKGPIHLRSNIRVVLEEGSEIHFSPNPEDYLPAVLTRWEGTEIFNYSPLIYAYHAVNVAIVGKGKLVGKGGEIFADFRPQQGPAQTKVRRIAGESVPLYERVFGAGDFLRPNMLQCYGCQNVLLQGFTIEDSPMWVNHIVHSKNVTVRGVTVESLHSNSDGLVIDSSVNVLVENNTFVTKDDSIVIKAGRDEDAERIGRPSERIVIRNNSMTGYNAIAFGSEMSGGIRSVFVDRNQLLDVRNAIYFKSNLDRGGVVEDIFVRNIDVEQAEYLVRFRTDYKGLRTNAEGVREDHMIRPPLFRNVLIENISCFRVSRTAIHCLGEEEINTITDVRMSNIQVDELWIDERLEYPEDQAPQAILMQGVDNFLLENVIIGGKDFSGLYSSE